MPTYDDDVVFLVSVNNNKELDANFAPNLLDSLSIQNYASNGGKVVQIKNVAPFSLGGLRNSGAWLAEANKKTPGTYTIKVKAGTNSGDDEVSQTITLNNALPSVNFGSVYFTADSVDIKNEEDGKAYSYNYKTFDLTGA